MRAIRLLPVLLLVAACAHRRPEPADGTGAEPAYPTDASAPAAGEYADELTDGVFAGDVTDGAFAGALTEAPPVTVLPPSPPPLGAESLAALPEASNPARGASLTLAQEGRLAWLNRDPARARQKLQSALQVWGANPWAKYYLGLLELDAGHYAQAVTFAREAARGLRQNAYWNARAHLLLATALERGGDHDGAFAARTKAANLDPRVELK